MIKAGYCFCYRCSTLFPIRDAYYKNATMPVGAKLTRSVINIGREPEWTIEPYHPKKEPIQQKDMPRLVSVPGSIEDGIPDSIKCTFGSEVQVRTLERSCPHCKAEHTILDKDNGRHPTFVVAMVGARGVGKTSWLEAISINTNLSLVNVVKGYPYYLEIDRSNPDVNTGAATVKHSSGATRYLRIVERETQKTVANVLFLDAAGEHFVNLSTSDGALQQDWFAGKGKYKGVDAVVYMDSANRETGDRMDDAEYDAYLNAFQVYKELKAQGVLKGKPVAVVYTHSDLMIRKKDASLPKVVDMSGKAVVLCNKQTFQQKDVQRNKQTSEEKVIYEPTELRRRWQQEHLIAKSINKTVLHEEGLNARGFMVQNCSAQQLLDKKTKNNFNNSFNVMDPLLWILNQLDLFPIPIK